MNFAGLDLTPRARDFPALAALLAAYLAAAVAGLQWTIIPGAGTAVWPASGIALAGLVIGGPRLWPAVFLGRFLAAVAVASPQPWWADAWVAAATTIGGVLPALLIRAGDPLDRRLSNLSDAARIVLLGGLGGALVSGPLAMAGLWTAGSPADRLLPTLAAWCLGFAVGVVVFAPLILSWWGAPLRSLSRRTWLHLAACLGCTALAAVLVFLAPPGGLLRTWHLLPPLVWAALAFNVRGVAPALAIVASVAVAAGVLGLGPLSELDGPPATRLLFGQQFLALVAVTMLVLASVADERRSKAKIERLEALRSAIMDAALDCIVTISDDDRVVEWNGACERVFGYTRADALGRDLTELIIPTHHAEAHRAGMQRYRATGEGPVLGKRLELEARRATGEIFPVELAISAIQVEGQPLFTAYLRDLAEQTASRAMALESEQRLRATYEHALAGIAEVSPEGQFLRVNERFCELTGYSRAELLERSFWDISHPDDHPEERARFRDHMNGDLGVYTVEKRYVRKDGRTVWVELSASRVVDGSGRPLYGIRVVHDVTERRRWEEQQLLLVNELNHRVKNTLATVQSIVAQTVRGSGAPSEVRESVEGRLMALSRAHDVLTQENWEGADLRDIAARAIAPFAGTAPRFRISGPHVRLTPRLALALSMALHELATNAAKYGSLSSESGTVRLSWTLVGGASPALRLDWVEFGGPEVAQPDRFGFGSRLLQKGLAQDLGGEVRLEFARDGVRCHIVAPLEAAAGLSSTEAVPAPAPP